MQLKFTSLFELKTSNSFYLNSNQFSNDYKIKIFEFFIKKIGGADKCGNVSDHETDI